MYKDDYMCWYESTQGITIKNINSIGTIKLLDDYINEWNAKIKNRYSFDKEFQFKIVLHENNDFGKAAAHYSFAQDIIIQNKLPIIHVTLVEDLCSVLDYDLLCDDEAKRYKKIVDSSVWNYYIPITKKEGSWNYDRFNNALEEIYRNTHPVNLYHLDVANEYAEFNFRLVQQSFLNRVNGGHKDISPFLFHSETEMNNNIRSYYVEAEKDNKDSIQKYKWRFLLLDDKCVKDMLPKGSNINKLKVVFNNMSRVLGFKESGIWFRRGFEEKKDAEGKLYIDIKYYGRVKNCNWETKDNPKENDDVKIVIDCVESVTEALLCLKYYEYEIILLDYLLINDKGRITEYGYELLKILKKDRTQCRIGPHNRLFFMFISAFTTAVQERMLEQGFDRREQGLWFIGDGACPTNTPYLFSYQLLLKMVHRLDDLKREYQGGFISIIELLNHIYVKETKDSIREKAHEHFNHVLYMRNKYRQLENDLTLEEEKALNGEMKNNGSFMLKMKSSLLVYSVFKVVHMFSGAFFEHLQYLVYLTAFGTIRQWEDLWEEYVFVRNELEEYDRLLGTKEGDAISEAIMKYIIGLKENAY